ncbi:MAG: amidase [Gammaproteobacteria bacterium]|nr:amidase [Gammaproteobacteria bacterium]
MKIAMQISQIITLLSVLLIAACEQGTEEVALENNISLDEVTITSLQEMMQAGELSSVQLVNYYLNRIIEIDPQLNSILEINPDAIEIAQNLDSERLNGQIRSPLHGIPVLLKDNIDTADNMLTTAGSLALVDAPLPLEDAFMVQRLKAAGAIILGKTNLSEWANFRSTSSSSGWSGRGGQARNPYVLDRTPCGSSAGSGVAVAANLTVVAVGTETDGSVVCPAAMNGIVGIKPTLGLISRSGIIPIAHSQDTAGPMARTVTDATLLLNAMLGTDSTDALTVEAESQLSSDYTLFLQNDGLSGKRIGVVRQLFINDPALNELLEDQLDILRQGGATLVNVEFNSIEELANAEFEVLLYEFKNDLNQYLQQRGGEYQSLEQLIQFNRDNAESEMPYFAQELFEMAQSKGDLSDEVYLTSLQLSKELAQAQGIDALIAEYQLDAFVAPSNGAAGQIDLENGDGSEGYIPSSSLAAVAGYPNITIPAGFINGLPIGISFFGTAFSEPTLLAIAYDYEQRGQARRAPTFLKSSVDTSNPR